MATVVILTARRDQRAPGPASAFFEHGRNDPLARALDARGHRVAMWWATPAGNCVTDDVDCCVLRTARGDNLTRARRLRDLGTVVINDPEAHEIAADKWTLFERLEVAGIAQPRTALAGELHGTQEIVRKPRHGGGGRDVRRYGPSSPPPKGHRDEIDQEFLVCERDLRVTVIGTEVTAAMARTPARGEWRTNLALGASFTALDTLDDDARSLALRAGAASNLVVCGIDLVFARNQWWVLEVNPATTLFAATPTQRQRTLDALCDAVAHSLEVS